MDVVEFEPYEKKKKIIWRGKPALMVMCPPTQIGYNYHLTVDTLIISKIYEAVRSMHKYLSLLLPMSR